MNAPVAEVNLEQTMADLHDTAMRVKYERDAAVKLLRRTLELAEIGSEGPHKSDVRAFLARIGEPVTITRFARQQAIEREISAFNPDTTEALELLHALGGSLQQRYGDARTDDLRKCLDDVDEALGEVEAQLLRDGSAL